MDECGLLDIFECGTLPLEIWVSDGLRWLVDNYRPFFQALKWPVELVLQNFEWALGSVPPTLMLIILTIIFALPPVVRLTNLGIRQVPDDVVEAMLAFGASDRQLLWKAQLPLAMPSIMAGINQTLMMSLSMVVIASMIAVGGLGQMVLRGIGRLDMRIATVGGLGIVLLAIVLDRLTQSIAESSRTRGGTSWPCGTRCKLPASGSGAIAMTWTT